MKVSFWSPSFFGSALVLFSTLALPVFAGVDKLVSTSLNTCMENSGVVASLFNVVFTPHDGVLRVDIRIQSNISGQLTAKIEILAYGFNAMTQVLDLCTMDGLQGLCQQPSPKPLDQLFIHTISPETVKKIPCELLNERRFQFDLGGIFFVDCESQID
jgi:hypothetical protein